MKTWGMLGRIGLLVALLVLGLGAAVPAMAETELVQICEIDGSCGMIDASLLEPVVFEPALEEAVAEVASFDEQFEEAMAFLAGLGLMCEPVTGECIFITELSEVQTAEAFVAAVEPEVALPEVAAEAMPFAEDIDPFSY